MPKFFRLSTGSQGNGFDTLSGASRTDDPDCKVHACAAIGAAEQVLDVFDRAYIVLADALNHQAALDPGLVRRTVWFDCTDQHSASRLVTERVGQLLIQIL